MPTPNHAALADARDRALEVRVLYEILEQRLNGKVWSDHELMVGSRTMSGTSGGSCWLAKAPGALTAVPPRSLSISFRKRSGGFSFLLIVSTST